MKDLSIQIKDLKKSVASLNKQIAIKEKKADDLQQKKDDEYIFNQQIKEFEQACSDLEESGLWVFQQFLCHKYSFEEGKTSAAKFKTLLKPLYNLIVNFDFDVQLNEFNLSEMKEGLVMAGYILK